MKFFYLIWVVVIISLLCIGGIIGQNDLEENISLNETLIDYDNITSNAINNIYNTSVNNYNFYHEDGYYNYDLGYMITETINYMTKITFRVARIGIKIGYNNPEFDFVMFNSIMSWGMIVVIILAILPVIPLVAAIVYLIFIVLKTIVMFLIKYFKELFLFGDK